MKDLQNWVRLASVIFTSGSMILSSCINTTVKKDTPVIQFNEADPHLGTQNASQKL